jgi:hypothetical protein
LGRVVNVNSIFVNCLQAVNMPQKAGKGSSKAAYGLSLAASSDSKGMYSDSRAANLHSKAEDGHSTATTFDLQAELFSPLHTPS